MNLLSLTRFDPRDVNAWSGTLYHMYYKLKEKHTVEIMGIELLNQLRYFTKDNFPRKESVPSDKYVLTIDQLLSERIKAANADLLFFGDLLFVPYLDVDIPIVYLSDITYDQLRPHYIKPNETQDEICISLEKRILEKASKIIYCSEWIKNKVVEDYSVDPDKIEIVDFGANIPAPLNYSIDIKTDVCRLVFIGKDWERKGGDKALQAYRILKREKFPCTLTITGNYLCDRTINIAGQWH